MQFAKSKLWCEMVKELSDGVTETQKKIAKTLKEIVTGENYL